MRTADLHHRVPRLRLPQHPQNLLFAVSSLAHTGSPLLLPENHNRPIPQLSIGLVFGFWVSNDDLDEAPIEPDAEDAAISTFDVDEGSGEPNQRRLAGVGGPHCHQVDELNQQGKGKARLHGRGNLHPREEEDQSGVQHLIGRPASLARTWPRKTIWPVETM